jgi:hypothetical protein
MQMYWKSSHSIWAHHHQLSARLPRFIRVGKKKERKEFSDYSGLQDGAACDPHQKNKPAALSRIDTLREVRESLQFYTLAKKQVLFFQLFKMRCVEMS